MTEPDTTRSPVDSGPRRSLVFVGALSSAALCILALVWVLTSQFNRQLSETCGSILTVVNPEGSSFEQLSSDVNSRKGVVRMLYSINRPGEANGRRSVIICAFGMSGYLASISPDLV